MKGDKLFIFSAPSGAGKTSIVRGVLREVPGLAFSVSACSRERRPGEQDGVDYYFMSPEGFREKIGQDAFLEWEEVYPGSYYGTLRSEVERLWGEGFHVVFDVDVAGGLKIKEQYPDQALSLFIRPPSLEVLKERLVNRQTESEESLKKRLGKAEQELSAARFFDHVIVNDRLDEAISEAVRMVKGFIARDKA